MLGVVLVFPLTVSLPTVMSNRAKDGLSLFSFIARNFPLVVSLQSLVYIGLQAF